MWHSSHISCQIYEELGIGNAIYFRSLTVGLDSIVYYLPEELINISSNHPHVLCGISLRNNLLANQLLISLPRKLYYCIYCINFIISKLNNYQKFYLFYFNNRHLTPDCIISAVSRQFYLNEVLIMYLNKSYAYYIYRQNHFSI